MFRTNENHVTHWLALVAVCLTLCVGTPGLWAQDVEMPSEDIPPPVEGEGDPFSDPEAEEAAEDADREGLYQSADEPEDLFLEDEDYIAEEYEADDSAYAFEDDCFGCGQTVCGSCRSPKVWYEAGYLLWWTKSVDPPPLATTSPVGTDPNVAGVLGEDNTTVLFGGSSLLGDTRGGGQFELGYWLDPCQTAALEINYLFLGEKNDDFFANQNRLPILARPFLNVETGLQDARLIALDNLVEGSLSINTSTSLHSSAFAYRNQLYRTRGCRIDYLLGYRFAYLRDSLEIRESTLALADADVPGTTIDLRDSFETRNMFHGGEFGFEMQRQIDKCWSCTLDARVAIGGSSLESNIRGRTVTDGGAPTSGGFLAQSTNIGSYRDTEFNTVSNIGVKLQRRLFTNTSLSFGYQFFMWSHLWRAADQIDTNVNTSQLDGPLVGAALPAFPGAATSYWAHGLSFNLEGRF